jgi:type IV pilus assembly protein PilM
MKLPETFQKLFKRKEQLVCIDIGATALKFIELDCSLSTPKLIKIGVENFKEEVYSNNLIVKPDKVAETVSKVVEKNGFEDYKAVTAIRGSSVFTKKIKVPKMNPRELRSHIQFEAGNLIPHSINALKLDYHILGESGKNNLDVLIVAVKNEVIDVLVQCFAMGGLPVSIVDVDHFAIQNIFEHSYEDLAASTTALVNIGSKFTSVNICRYGVPLFTGDISVGGKGLTDTITESTSMSFEEAEKFKTGELKNHPEAEVAEELLRINVEYLANEINRQLNFMWSAAENDEGIDTILLSGGGGKLQGLSESLEEKTGIKTEVLDPFKAIMTDEEIRSEVLQKCSSQMAVCMGLGLRKSGDRISL